MLLQRPEAAEVVQALERVYARPELQPPRRGLLHLLSELWEAVRYWFGTLLRGWLPESWHPAFSWLLLGLVVAVAVWAMVALVSSFGARTPRARTPASPGMLLQRGDAADWEGAARAAAADGRFRDAALALYHAALLRLDERGLIRFHPARTPGDYRRELPATVAEKRPFDAFVRRLLPVAFGAREPDRASYDSLRSAAAELGVHG
jgi:hypothetical protein